MYAVTIYLSLRASELAGLRVPDWERDAGRVHVHLQRDRKTGDLVPTKTCRPRYVPVTELTPLLAVLATEAEAAGTEFFFPDLPPLEDLASQLREDLRTAGLTRETLFADDQTRRHIRFHDRLHVQRLQRLRRGHALRHPGGRSDDSDLPSVL